MHPHRTRFGSCLFTTALMAIMLVGSWPAAHAGEASRRPAGATAAVPVGSGAVRTEERAVPGFQAIELTGPIHLVVRQGTREAVAVRTDDNLLRSIETRVVIQAGVPTLEIGLRPEANRATRGDITVTVDVVSLAGIAASGSGEVVCDGLKAPSLQLTLTGSGGARLRQLEVVELRLKTSGSGLAELAGRADKLAVSMDGSSQVKARQLAVRDASVSISGGGNASVNALRTLSVSIAGSGGVRYSGNPTLSRAIAGSGSVSKD